MLLAALINVPAGIGYPLLFGFVAAESAGALVPGETSLIVRMPWPRFLLWNALGGTAWATTVGALAYVLGRSASGSLGAIGFVGLGVAVLVYVIARVRRRRHAHSRKPPPGRPPEQAPR